ncbi:hypothetical protein [Novipirellula rosea]|uniref:Uncharacterized protein n=1 Tax=Novipirellula rosea TaxID=1031540 RepID=A0ABP8MHU8_9BACT
MIKGSETMGTTVDASMQWVESITVLRLPKQADQQLQVLMDRNNEVLLGEQERADLALYLHGNTARRDRSCWRSLQNSESHKLPPSGTARSCVPIF